MTGRKRKTADKDTKPTKKPKKTVVSSDESSESEEKLPVSKKEPAAKKRKTVKDETNDEDTKPWKKFELLSELENIDQQTSRNIIDLLDDGMEIPFIARYRKEATGNMDPDALRSVKNTYQQIVNLELKTESVLKNIEKENLLTPDIKFQIQSVKTLEELEVVYAPFKPTSKGSLFERAKKVGLEDPAKMILEGTDLISLEKLVNPKTEELESLEKVKDGIKNILSHLITKNSEVLTEIRKLRNQFKIILTSTQVKAKKSKDQDQKDSKKKDEYKFENYFDFSMPTSYLKPHQILAINRGESLKILTVKLQVDERVKKCLKYFLQNLYLKRGRKYQLRDELFEESFNEAYSKKITPLIQRQERADLIKRAEKASVQVFANNLKQLLLLSPNREVILGIDPGFTNGCKLAMISKNGDLLETSCFYLHNSGGSKASQYGHELAEMLEKHNCSIIALGNGTGCRETEAWITGLYDKGVLSKNVRYCIVNEQGASIYSCGPLAKKEFPKLDVNLISAVSIARRLLDPLGEYVKIDAKHLGMGQYQHDINEKTLTSTLNEIVVECVSFVGVDINSTSETLLSHVAGLSQKRAEAIIQHRIKNGPFQSRKDILKVKGIGKVAFENCAGFLRIDPNTAEVQYYNLLDSTWVHPESYDLAEKIIKALGLSNKDVGKSFFIKKFKDNLDKAESFATKFQEPVEKIEMIFNALQREFSRDYRMDLDNKPLFKQGLTKITDLRVGQILSGAVINNTDFGSFVDIGVHLNGLIHKSKMNGSVLKINDRVQVKILSLEVEKGRIGLNLEGVL